MRQLIYIFVFFLLSGRAFADCANGTCDMSGQYGSAGSAAGTGEEAAELQSAYLQGKSNQEKEDLGKLDKKLQEVQAERGKEGADQAALDAKEKQINEEKKKLTEQHQKTNEDLLKQKAQKLVSQSGKQANNAGSQQAKSNGNSSGGLPFLPPKNDSGGKDDGGEEKKDQTLQAPKVPTPAPIPNNQSPTPAKAAELLSDADFKTQMAEAGKSQFDSSVGSLSAKEIAQAQSALALQTQEMKATQSEIAAARAQLALKELEAGVTPRNTKADTASLASNASNASRSSGLPFDLSSSDKGAVKAAVKMNPTTRTVSGEMPIVRAAVQPALQKVEAASRLLASATETSASPPAFVAVCGSDGSKLSKSAWASLWNPVEIDPPGFLLSNGDSQNTPSDHDLALGGSRGNESRELSAANRSSRCQAGLLS